MRVTLTGIEATQKYWSELTGVPLESFQKPFFIKVKWRKQYDDPENYWGILRIRVRKSLNFLRKVHGWIKGLGEVGKNQSDTKGGERNWFLKYVGSWKGTYLDSDEFWEGILTKDSKPVEETMI